MDKANTVKRNDGWNRGAVGKKRDPHPGPLSRRSTSHGVRGSSALRLVLRLARRRSPNNFDHRTGAF